LREIRVDLARLSDELSNITKFFGDWHLARIYENISARFHLGDWHRTIDEKLKTLANLYQLLQHDQTNRWMLMLEATIVLLFVIGTSVPQQVHFVATVQLFRFKPLAWLLKQCGIIPVNRLKDDPRAMRSVADTFEACFKILEQGGAVGIFPEGVTYDDSQLKTVKTGAARMALE